MLLLFALTSCKLPTTEYGEESTKKVELPDQTADTIDVIYSEQGIIKLKLSSPTLIMRDTPKEQYNEFPDGVDITFYDKEGKENAVLHANYGIDNPRTKMRSVRDSVIIVSKKDGYTYSTNQLFIDERNDSVYNEGKYVKIVKPDGTFLQGYGFLSTTRMDKITIKNIFNSTVPVDENSVNSKLLPDDKNQKQNQLPK